MKDIDFLQENPLKDTVITDISVSEWFSVRERTEHAEDVYSVRFEGDLPHTGEDRHYSLSFHRVWAKAADEAAALKTHLQTLKALKKPTLKEIKVVPAEDGYAVDLVLTEDGHELYISFFCDNFFLSRLRYRGFDYTNVYGTQEYMDMIQKRRCVLDEKYFFDEEITDLSDGYSLCQRTYVYELEDGMHAGVRCELRKDGKCVYAYNCMDEPPNHLLKDFIYHSNGHRYYPFHIDWFGISYIDVDTLEVYHYVPRGYDDGHGAPNGYSFIITGVHYDPKTNLVAYDGCYGPCPDDIMVGSLDNPLHFDPHLISVSDICYEKYGISGITGVANWEEDGLSVKLHDEKTVKISMEDLKMEMEKQRGDA